MMAVGRGERFKAEKGVGSWDVRQKCNVRYYEVDPSLFTTQQNLAEGENDLCRIP